MIADRDLAIMLENLSVRRRDGVFVFTSVEGDVPTVGDGVEAVVVEAEAVTVVASRSLADRRGWAYDFEAAWLTLEVHSALDAVGLTAAVSAVLTEAGIACNVIAANFHDHVLVPIDRCEAAIAAIESLRAAPMQLLAEQAWPAVERGATLLLPLGSTEQHGPHLPLDTDARIANAVARRAGAATRAVVAPVVAYGASGEHAGFAGTLSIGTDVLRQLLVELVRSASSTFAGVVLVNGHGGNHDAVEAAARQLVAEGHHVDVWSPRIPGGDAHAGRTETSLMLAIAPASVLVERAAAGRTEPLTELIGKLRRTGVAGVSPNGVLGDPAGASVAEGHELLDALVADLVATIEKRVANSKP